MAPSHRTDPNAAMQYAPLQNRHGPGTGLARVQHQARQALGLESSESAKGYRCRVQVGIDGQESVKDGPRILLRVKGNCSLA